MTTIFADPSYFMPPLLAGAVTLVLLAVALVWSRRNFTTWLFCGFLISMALTNFVVFAMRTSPSINPALFWERAGIITAVAAFVLYYHFTLVYTNTKGQKYALRAAYLFLIVAVALAPTDLIIREMYVIQYGYAPIVAPASYIWFAAGPLLVLGAAYNLLRSYGVSTLPEERKRLIILAIATTLPIIGMLWDGFTKLPPLSVWSNLLFTILCTIAILKYHLLDIRVVIRKSLVYLLVSGIAAVPYVGILLLVSHFSGPIAGAWWLYAIMLLLLAILLRPLYGWAQNIVDRFCFRERYDYLMALEQFSRQAQSLVNLEELGCRMIQLLSGALGASSVSLLLKSESKHGLVLISSAGLENPRPRVVLRKNSPLVEWLDLHGDILSSEQLDVIPELQSFSLKERNNLERMGAKLYVPIKAREGRLSGILVLGGKLSEQSYSEDDMHLLTALSNQMAMAIDNARLYEEMRESEEKLRLMFEAVTDGIIVTDLNDIVTAVNERMLEMHGFGSKDEVLGKSVFEFIAPHERKKAIINMQKTLAHGFVKVIEYTLLKADGSEFPGELGASVLKDTSGNPVGLIAITRDITERKRIEMALRESEKFNSSLLTNSPNPILVLNADASIRYVNLALEKLTGFSSAELVGRNPPYPWWMEETSEESRIKLRKATRRRAGKYKQLFRKKNREKFWAEVTFETVTMDGEFEYHLSNWVDLTEQERLRENMEFYISEITRAQEEERKRIAREIHDESIQTLATLALDIDGISREKERLPEDITSRLDRLRAEVNGILKGLRRFSHELRPGVIDQVGMVSALEILTEELNKENSVKTSLEVAGSERRLMPETELTLFRIAQEALRNVKKHSGATKAAIRLKFTRSRVKLVVSDNGIGFELPEMLGDFATKGKLGLIGMQERARLLNGKFSVKSHIGRGTTVVVEVSSTDRNMIS